MTSTLLKIMLAGVAAVLLCLVTWQSGLFDPWENTTWRWRVQSYAQPEAATKLIKLILVDQYSLDWGARVQGLEWPWPREVYAAIVRFLQRGGARVVVLDVLLTEDSFYGVDDDQRLGQALREADNVVTAMFLSPGQSGQATDWPSGFNVPAWPIDGLQPWLAAPTRRHLAMRRAAFPIPAVAANSAGFGHVTGHPDQDAVHRRANLFDLFAGRVAPSLGLAAYLLGHPDSQLRIEDGWLSINDLQVPVDRQGGVILNYRGPTDTYKPYTMAKILEAEINLSQGVEAAIHPEVFKDAYVLLGFSAPGLKDLRPTPLSPNAPGVMVHATLLDNLLQGDALRDVPTLAVMALTVLLSGIAAGAMAHCRKALQTVLISAILLPLPVVLAFLAYGQGYWLPMVAPGLALALTLASGILINYATEGRQRAYIKKAFEHYLSPAVIQRLLDDPSRLQLGGERHELSIMFTDLQGFSSISEAMEPQELTELLNDYLSDMTSIILEEAGTLDKYEGDAIIAFWNAPVGQPDHAVRVCRAALRCHRKLDERRQEFYERTGAKLFMRIGINSGDVVVGNMGSHERFDYTVLGDNANLAARLEGANKVFNTWLMVSESTWVQAKHAFVGREIAAIRVVGRQTPVTVYEILGFAGEARPAYLDGYEDALRLYREGQYEAALRRFAQQPEDRLCQVYVVQCREALKQDSGTFDPVWNLTSK